MRRIRQLTVLALALIGAAGAQAVTVPTQAECLQRATLSDLFGGACIIAGDKLFDQFSPVDYNATDGRLFNGANILVTPLNDGGLDPGPGLSFSVLNDELSIFGDGIFAFIDFAFGFHVTAGPGFAIKDNSLSLGGTLQTQAEGGFDDLGMTILEWVGDGLVLNPATPGYISTEFSALDGVVTPPDPAHSNFAPRSDYWVTKDILVFATNELESAALTSFNQRFSQQSVPEPGTLALLALAMAAGVGVSRRRATA